MDMIARRSVNRAVMVSHTSRHAREGRRNVSPVKRASLDDIKRMREAGELSQDPSAPASVEPLDAGFWEKARLPAAARCSVHLKLDPEVFHLFKREGKGHLTRMKYVLKAYVRTQSWRAARLKHRIIATLDSPW